MAKGTKKKTFNLKAHLRSALRAAWRRTPMRSAAIKAARIAPATYVCAGCNEHLKVVKGTRRPYAVDHIEAVTPPAPWTWDDYISRLMCGPDGLQILCHTCHKAKTANERAARRSA